MATLAEIIARAEQIAVGRGIDPHTSPVLDGLMTFEALYPHVLRYVFTRGLMARPETVEDFMRDSTIALVANVGTLPDTVLRQFLSHSFLPAYPFATMVRYIDYTRSRFDTMLSYYAFRDNEIYFNVAVGSVVLRTPTLPDVPATAATNLDLSPRLVEDVIAALAAVMIGELPVASLLAY
jgi:hypothetical protein